MTPERAAPRAIPPALEGVGSPPTAADVARVAGHLRGRAAGLRARATVEIAGALGRVGARFLDEADPLRRRALERLPEAAHLSPEMARAVLQGMARDWTEERLLGLVAAELGGPDRLDKLVREGPAPGPGVRSLMAVGPALCVQIVSGSVPGVGVNALVRSLLVKAPTLLKPGRGDALLPTLFAEALRDEDEALADALAVVYWPGGSTELEEAALAGAEVAVVYGSDETVASLRAMAPPTTRVVAYHHRIGVGVVGRGALDRTRPEASPRPDRTTAPDEGVDRATASASDVARAVALFEQRGCVCPQLVFVEEGGEVGPADFARLLAEALGALEEELPSPAASVEEAAALQQLRGTAEMQAASGGVEVHHGGARASWTVVFEPEPVAGPAAGSARTVRVRPIDDVARLAEALEPLGSHLQSVGYAGLGARAESLAEALGRTGASRVTPFRALPFPPPWWLHDGRGPLRDLVRWVELERE